MWDPRFGKHVRSEMGLCFLRVSSEIAGALRLHWNAPLAPQKKQLLFCGGACALKIKDYSREVEFVTKRQDIGTGVFESSPLFRLF